MQLYRLERYSECRSAYTDLIRNSQDEYEEERKTNLAAVVASVSQWENAPAVSTRRPFVRSVWAGTAPVLTLLSFWLLSGPSGSSRVNLRAVLQRRLCFDRPRETRRGLEQTPAGRGWARPLPLRPLKSPPLKRTLVFSLTELCRVSLAEDSVSLAAFVSLKTPVVKCFVVRLLRPLFFPPTQ